MSDVEYPMWAWIAFFVVILLALFVDLGVANRRAHVPTRSETFVWSAVWVSLALAFNGFIYILVERNLGGHDLALAKAKEFFTGYLIELSLSVDNLFVFLLIFNYFKVPQKYQHRVLFWGIFMALLMRMAMIFAGAELVEKFEWLLYLFGAFLLYTGFKMFFESDSDFNPEKSRVIRLITKFIPISKEYDGEKFFIVTAGRRAGTILLLVLIIINVADLIFAVDSIPAIFGITTDKFIVYTSNIFAILGLRTFFFLLVDAAERFHLLKYGLAVVLTFIGVKMLLPLMAEGLIMIMGYSGDSTPSVFLRRFVNHDFDWFVINISLSFVITALVFSVVLSLIFPKPQGTPEDR